MESVTGSMASSSSGATSSPSSVQDDAPLWAYVEKLDRAKEGGGNLQFRCRFCNITFKGSYSRVKAHLLKISGQGIRACAKVSHQSLSEMQKVMEEAEERKKSSMPKNVPLPPPKVFGSSTSKSSTMGPMLSGGWSFRMDGLDSRKRKATSGTAIEKAFNLGARDHLNSEIARMFYSSGLPFHLARNPYYASAFTYAANNTISGYIPPGYNMLRTTLLQREKANVERLLEPIKGTWKEKGVTIVSDGWTDPQRRPLLNFMAVTESGPMFLKAVNCEGEYKDKHFIANLIKEVIVEVGPQNVVQVITDNAPVCKAAGMIVETQFAHIFWTPCVVHTLNLALKNICAAKNTEQNEEIYGLCYWITEVSSDAMMVKNFIMNHSMRLAMFNEFVSLKLLSIAETRFASVVVMLRRFKLIKGGLQSLVISEKWSCYRDDDVVKARLVKEKILDDLWWDNVDYILSFTAPIYEMLRAADTDKPCLHLIYDTWDSMIEKVRATIFRHEGKRDNEESSFYNAVHGILVDRWNKSNTPLHCLAHSLNPRYYSPGWLSESPNRVPPHKDLEISNERNKCLKRYFDNPDTRRIVNVEYAKFSTNVGDFSDHDSIRDRGEMEPQIWWVIHGASAPTLQSLALKLLGQPCSSSCCERNWSTYSFVHSVKRNLMTPQRAEDLVFVHNNLRLLSRRSPQYMQGECKMWDIGGDAFDTFGEGGVLEVANLSLDEPDLEAVFFTDGDDGEAHDEEGIDADLAE